MDSALEQFLYSSPHRSPKTIQTLLERLLPLTAFLADKFQILSPLDVSLVHIEDFLRHIAKGRRGNPLSESSVFGFAKDVQAFINYVADNIAPDDWPNPVRKMKLRRPQTRVRPLSRQQVAGLLTLAGSQARTPFLRTRNQAMLMVLFDGALRVGELMGARRDLLREDGSLVVVGKGGKEREVALAAETVSRVNDYLDIRTDSSHFLFAGRDGKPISYYAIKSLFHRLRKANPNAFPGVRLSAHTLRHTSATLRRIVGMSEGDLQTFLGHSSPEMTRHYSVMALENAAKESARRTSPMLNFPNDLSG